MTVNVDIVRYVGSRVPEELCPKLKVERKKQSREDGFRKALEKKVNYFLKILS